MFHIFFDQASSVSLWLLILGCPWVPLQISELCLVFVHLWLNLGSLSWHQLIFFPYNLPLKTASVTLSVPPTSSLALASIDAVSADTLAPGEREIQELWFSFSKNAEIHIADHFLPDTENCLKSIGVSPSLSSLLPKVFTELLLWAKPFARC